MNPIIQSGVVCYNINNVTNQAMYGNCRYIASNSSLTTFTLPSAILAGQCIEVIGYNSAGWTISLGAGKSINWIDSTGTISLSSGKHDSYSYVKLICVVPNTVWNIIGSEGSLLLK